MLNKNGANRKVYNHLAPAFFVPQHMHYKALEPNFRDINGSMILNVGFPKSGNVWLSSLIACALDLDVCSSENRCFVSFTHSALDNNILFDPGILRGACLIRDLRDIVVSLFHYLRSDGFQTNASPHHIYDNIADMYFHFFVNYYTRYVNDFEGLLDRYVEFGWPVIRYESLYDNPENVLTMLFERWQIPVSSESIKNAVNQSSMSSMKAGGGKKLNKTTLSHFRKGGYGNYRDELPTEVQEDIFRRYGDYLKRWGYSTTPDAAS